MSEDGRSRNRGSSVSYYKCENGEKGKRQPKQQAELTKYFRSIAPETKTTRDQLAVLRQQDPLAPARLRGLREREKLLQVEGGTVGVDEAAALLGISRQAVDKRRRAGKLIGLTLGRRGYMYPVWQFSQGGTLPGLEEVLTELRGHDPWMQAIFMLSENTRLSGQAPLHELRHGHVDDVRRAARMLGEHGAA